MIKADKEKVLKILRDCITHPEVDEDDEALVDYRLAKLMIMSIQEEPSYHSKSNTWERKRERRMWTCSHSKKRRKKSQSQHFRPSRTERRRARSCR